MAVQETRTLPAPFIEGLGKDYATELKGLYQKPIDTKMFQPGVAPQHQLQTDAASLAGTGLGGYAPYIAQAGQYSGPSGYSGFESPYQQEVINKTLEDYDRQAQVQQQGIMDQATRMNALGAGRTGVQLAEYQAGSDRNRALMDYQMRQQGFGQAQQGAQAAFGQQMNLAQTQPQLVGQQIGAMGQVGALQQAQDQATLDQQREANRMAAYEPWERLQAYGTGITGIMGGMPGQYQWSNVPNPTPLQTALGIGATAGGIYGNVMGPMRGMEYGK